MNYEPNDIHWRRGDTVIHDCDAKEPKMLMKVIGFTRDGLVKTQYVDKRRRRKIFKNELRYLHDPKLWNFNPDWGDAAQEHIERYQDEWEQASWWNHWHQPGLNVRTTSADGGFETVTTGKARFDDTGHAKVYLERGGWWWLKFVEPVKAALK